MVWQMPDLMGVATAGAIAGFAKTMVSHPLDTVKVHIQNKRAVPRTIRALYRGIAVPFVRNGVEHSTHFLFRGLVASSLAMSGIPGAENAWLVGFLAGFPQSFVNTPMDYVRLQLQLKQQVKVAMLYRGLPWVVAKEATSGMIFYGFYEGFRSMSWPAGLAGSSSALLAMTLTYPVDVFKTRVQAGETFTSAKKMAGFSGGLSWALGKCIISNFIALTVYEAACVYLNAKQPIDRLKADASEASKNDEVKSSPAVPKAT